MKKTIASWQAFPTSAQRSRFRRALVALRARIQLSSRFALAFNFPPPSPLYAGHASQRSRFRRASRSHSTLVALRARIQLPPSLPFVRRPRKPTIALSSRSRRASRSHSTSPLPPLCTPATQANLVRCCLLAVIVNRNCDLRHIY